MPRRKSVNPSVRYVSPKLRARLNALADARTAFVVAPSGYGKSVAINEFLHGDADIPALHFTILDSETPAVGWARFCELLGRIDPVASAELLSIGAPDANNIGEIGEIFAQVECPGRTALVLDNIQHWANAFPSDLIGIFASHTPGLLVILISQPLQGDPFLGRSDVLRIDQRHLIFAPADIAKYFAKAGLPIGAADAAAIHAATEGWAAAVYLHLLNYSDTGELTSAPGDILSLMRECFWNRHDAAAREALLRVSVFPCFSAAQLAFMLGGGELPASVARMLGGAGFLRYDPEQRLYFPHAILLRLLAEEFDALPARRRGEIYVRAGEWNERAGSKLAAYSCYHMAGDYERLLSIVPTDFEILDSARVFTPERLAQLLSDCPDDIKRNHLMTLIAIAYEFFSAGEYERYGALCAEITALIPESALPEAEKNRLWGELAVMESFAVYNDIRAMSDCHRRAHALIGGRSQIVDISVPWMMGCPSVLYMFHREAGHLAETAACLSDCLPVYHQLAAGHGAGADRLMRAEASFYRGDWAGAEAHALEAAFLAEEAHQHSVALAARHLLVRAALMRGERALLEDALARVESIERGGAFPLRRQSELSFGHLWCVNDRPQEVPEWITGEGAESVSAPAVPYARMVFLEHAFGLRKYREVCALSEAFLSRAEAANVLLPQIYIHILRACAEYREGRLFPAQKAMRAAIALAVPDGLLVPFAEYAETALPLLETLHLDGGAKPLHSIRRIASDAASGRARLHHAFSVQQRPFSLTTREYEIALLAAQRHSNIEIAEATCLAVATVRTHLQAVYDKLGIDSRLKSKRNLLAERLSAR